MMFMLFSFLNEKQLPKARRHTAAEDAAVQRGCHQQSTAVRGPARGLALRHQSLSPQILSKSLTTYPICF